MVVPKRGLVTLTVIGPAVPVDLEPEAGRAAAQRHEAGADAGVPAPLTSISTGSSRKGSLLPAWSRARTMTRTQSLPLAAMVVAIGDDLEASSATGSATKRTVLTGLPPT